MRNALEDIFKIKITDESLFTKALTHPSFTKENNINSKTCRIWNVNQKI